MKLRMGTRRSLLARAQSAAVARALEKLHPGLRVETVGIETKGDRIVDVPLRLAEGKDFFVAELDRALLSGEIDFAVHSLKDLSLTRPEGVAMAAIPRREDARDVLILSPDAGARLRVGSSSPRRLENAPPLLRALLPEADLQMVEIRGNVNTRLSRLHLPADDERKLEGVLLAAAGLSRLLRDEEGARELEVLLRGTRRALLPLRENPTAPGQGALAIECRAGDSGTRKLLEALHDEATARAVRSERELFASYGGGCHQRFGVTEIVHPEAGTLRFSCGVSPSGERIDALDWEEPEAPAAGSKGFDSSLDRTERGTEEALPWKAPAGAPGVLFVSHARALPDAALPFAGKQVVIASGAATARKLAGKGLFVSASAEGLGEEWCRATLPRELLGLPPDAPWRTLSHEGAVAAAEGSLPIATYRVRNREAKAPDLEGFTHFFWSSVERFQALRAALPPGARHASGPGKTAAFLRKEGVSVQVFPSREEWIRWIKA